MAKSYQVHRGELQDLKKRLSTMLPPPSKEKLKEGKRPRPYAAPTKEVLPQWMMDRSLLPRKPPGK